MKKLALVFAIALIAAITAPAFAGEFTLNGSYRVGAVYSDYGTNTTNDSDESSYFYQRFRLPFAWKVNDNVQAFMRTDWAERNRNSITGETFGAANWGAESLYGGNSHNGGGAMQIDYAWVKITQPMFDLTIGRQEVLLGHWSGLDIDQEGITMNIKLQPVTITLAYGKLNEGAANVLDATGHRTSGGASLNDDGDNADADSYAAQINYAGQGWNIGGYYAYAIDRAAAFDNVKDGFAVFGGVTMGQWSFKGELDILGGEKSSTVDYKGLNLWGDLSYKASDALTVGLAAYYAKGYNDADEEQLSSIDSSGFSYQIFDYDFNSALAISIFPQLTADNFEVCGANAGMQAIKGYLRYKVLPEVTLFGMLGYATPDKDVAIDSRFYAVGSVDYAWLPNVTLSAGAAYINTDSTPEVDNAVQLTARLGVSF